MKQQAETYTETPQFSNVPEASRSGASHRCPSLTLNEIRDQAYAKWVAAGSPPGDNSRFWLEAEKELLQGSQR